MTSLNDFLHSISVLFLQHHEDQNVFTANVVAAAEKPPGSSDSSSNITILVARNSGFEKQSSSLRGYARVLECFLAVPENPAGVEVDWVCFDEILEHAVSFCETTINKYRGEGRCSSGTEF